MVLFRDRDGELRRDRRDSERSFLIREAELDHSGEVQPVTLTDLSMTGARIEVPAPPAKGAQVHLRWDDQDISCVIQWTDDGACGLAFDAPLPESAVKAASDRRKNGPRVPLGKTRLAVGRRRTRPAARL